METNAKSNSFKKEKKESLPLCRVNQGWEKCVGDCWFSMKSSKNQNKEKQKRTYLL